MFFVLLSFGGFFGFCLFGFGVFCLFGGFFVVF